MVAKPLTQKNAWLRLKGLTLIELLVTMVISSVVMIGVSQLTIGMTLNSAKLKADLNGTMEAMNIANLVVANLQKAGSGKLAPVDAMHYNGSSKVTYVTRTSVDLPARGGNFSFNGSTISIPSTLCSGTIDDVDQDCACLFGAKVGAGHQAPSTYINHYVVASDELGTARLGKVNSVTDSGATCEFGITPISGSEWGALGSGSGPTSNVTMTPVDLVQYEVQAPNLILRRVASNGTWPASGSEEVVVSPVVKALRVDMSNETFISVDVTTKVHDIYAPCPFDESGTDKCFNAEASATFENSLAIH